MADPRLAMAEGDMSTRQILGVALCVVLNALDGFDVLAITFAAPSLAAEWRLAPHEIGLVISIGLIAMAVGSLFLAPVADVLGRRKIILLCLVLMGAGMLLSATSASVWQMSLWRALTGIGIGGMLGAINALASEYANKKRKALAVALMAMGYPLGGVLGGLAAAWLLDQFGWQAIFVAGGLTTLVLLPLIFFGLPESIEFLIARRPSNALPRLNAILRKFRLTELPALPASSASQTRLSDIFTGRIASKTAFVGISYFFHIMAFYYALGWIPSIVASLGYSSSIGATVSVWANLGGMIFCVLTGWLAFRLGLYRLTAAVMIATAVSLIAFGNANPGLGELKLIAFLIGGFAFSGVSGLYAVLADTYPAQLRSTGTGFVIGLGRGGATLGPLVAGYMMSAGLPRGQVAAIMALAAFVAAAAMFKLMKLNRA